MGKGEESHRWTRDMAGSGSSGGVMWSEMADSKATLHCVRSKESTRVLNNKMVQLNKGEGNLQYSCCCEYSTFRFGVQFSLNWVHNIWPPPEP